MPVELSLKECIEKGISFTGTVMDNGESRFRIMNGARNSGYGYILTSMPKDERGWQNSHFHKSIRETYIVQRGWIGCAILKSNKTVHFYIYHENEIFTTEVNQPHNIYMSAGAVIHTVKHGDCSLEKDWFGSPLLDALSKGVSEEELLRK